jgi:hypothetical protein
MAQEGGVEAGGFNQVATLKDVHCWFANPNKKSEIFSVINEEMRKVALERGYIEMQMVHLTDIASLPLPCNDATTDEGTNSA